MNYKINLIENIATSNSYINVNKKFIRELGITEAVLLSELLSSLIHFNKKGGLVNLDDTDDLYFFYTSERMRNELNISYKVVRTAIKTLETKNLIKVLVKGIPKKTYYTVCIDSVINLLSTDNETIYSYEDENEDDSNFTKRENQYCPKGNINNSQTEELIFPQGNDYYITNNKTNNKTNNFNNTPPQKKSKSKKEVEVIEEKFPFGEHQNVKLSLDEKEKLLQRWGADVFQQIVDKLSNYKLSSGTKYKSDYGAINNWVAKQVEKDNRFSSLNNNNNGNSQSKSGKQYFNLEPGWSNLTGDEWWMRPYTYKGSTGEDDNVPK